MSNVLFEIGCEEIPARFMPGFLADLKKKAEEKLARERLTFDAVATVGTGTTTMLRAMVPVSVLASVTRAVKLYVPATFGVPLMTPAAFMLRPGGRAPAVIDQV